MGRIRAKQLQELEDGVRQRLMSHHLTPCAKMTKLPDLPEPPFSHLQIRITIIPISQGCSEDLTTTVYVEAQCLAHGEQ